MPESLPLYLVDTDVTTKADHWSMASLVEALQGDADPSPPPETAILFVVVSLLAGIVSRQVLHKTKVPYTVVLLLIGMGMGALEYGTQRGIGVFGQSIRMWSDIHPNLILYVFLPALLFESSFSMEVHQIKRCLVQMLLLAGPGVIISTFCLGLVHHFIFPYGWNWSISLLLGGLLSATDPVAVVSLLKEVGASKKLGTLIEGESLMNDGTAMVVFELFRRMVIGTHFTFGSIIQFLSQVALGAVGLGLLFGLLSFLWLGFIFNDTIMEITLTFTASYCVFFVGQSVAQVSGVLSVMTIGIFLGVFAKTAFRGESQQSMHHFWTIIAYFANTLIFIISGVVIAESLLRSHEYIERRDWAYLFVLYIFLQVSRAVVVLVLYPGLSYCGYGLTPKEAAVLVWAGLRGAVALALSLSLQDTETPGFNEVTQAKFVFFTGGIVFLTLIINGSTTQFLLRFLHIEKTSETKRLIVEHVKYEMNRKAIEAFQELGEDEELGPAEWKTVEKYVSCVKRFHEEERPTHPHQPSTEVESRRIQMQDTRVRLLNGVQAAYWEMLEEGRITQTAAIILMQSVDEALDKVHDRLVDWEGLHPHVHFPGYLKHLQLGVTWLPERISQKVSTYLIVERLELGCYISAAFLRAHIIARRHLHDFIGETEVSKSIINESEDEAVEAKQFLEDIRLTFSQILRVVKTKQVVHAILLRLLDYIESLQKSGLLEERETTPLHDAVQGELKKLLRRPPGVTMPKGSEVSRSQPFIAALPMDLQQPIVSHAKEFLKLRGNYLYKEGEKPDGLWLIASGVVKWSKGDAANGSLLHPTFSHGSTLGLYEVLVGRPYLCSMVADSVVQCFYIEGSKLLSVFRTEPSQMEQLVWRESAFAISKILMPHLFELTPIQKLRTLAHASSLLSFLRGEIVELSHGEVAILLEGFVKNEGNDELVGAPAGLIHSFHKFRGPLSRPCIHHGNTFHVETRSTMIVFPNVISKSSTSSSSLLPRRSSMGRDSFTLKSRRRNSEVQQNESIQPIGLPKKPSDSKTKGLAALKSGSTGQMLQQGNYSFSGPKGLSIPPIHGTTKAHSTSTPEVSGEKETTSIARPGLPADDESSSDDEHIIQIESPSSLTFNVHF